MKLTVTPGRKPLVQLAPALVEVANPMSEEPPLEMRPTWNALTMADPKENVSGSTSVMCCASVSVKVSVLSCTRGICACAAAENRKMADSSSNAINTDEGPRSPDHQRFILIEIFLVREIREADEMPRSTGNFIDHSRKIQKARLKKTISASSAGVNVNAFS